jgi:hypothetical protein
MRAALARSLAAIGVVAFAAAVVFVHPAQAEQPNPAVKSDLPEGYVLVNQETLRQLVHEEVATQLHDLIRREQQQREAAGRIQSLATMPATARAQIALYRLQHNDRIPSLDQMGDGFKFLTRTTDADGRGSEAPNAFGPYFQHPLVNPLTGKSKVAALGKATTEDGWSYDEQTGMVKAVLPKQLESQLKGRVSQRDVEFAVAG